MSTFTQEELDQFEKELLGGESDNDSVDNNDVIDEMNDDITDDIKIIKTVRPLKPKRKPKKKRLIDDIIKLKEVVGLPYSKRTLERTKVDQLEYQLKELFKEHSNKIILGNGHEEPDNNTEEAFIDVNEPQPAEPTKIKNPSSKYGVNMLYQMNVIMAVVCEKTVNNYKDDLGFKLNGYADSIQDHRAELLPILEEIFRENESMLVEVCNPMVAYALFMIGCGANCVEKIDNNNNIDSQYIDEPEYRTENVEAVIS